MNEKAITDLALAGTTITAPMWLSGANEWLTFIVLTLGIVLAAMRIYAMVKNKDPD